MTTSTEWQLARDAAEQYQKVLVPSILGPAASTLVEWAEIERSVAVIDVGCGTGAATRLAAEKVGATGHVVGIDVNSGMIQVARSLPIPEGATVEWRECSAYELSSEDQSVDVVLCAQTLQFLADRPAALVEIHRVLKLGGRLCVGLWSELQESPYFHSLVESVGKHIGEKTAAGLRSAFGLSDAEQIRTLLEEAGYSGIKMAVKPIELDLPLPSVFVPIHIRATPMAAGFEAASPEARKSVVRDVAKKLALYENGEGIRVPFTTHLAVATK